MLINLDFEKAYDSVRREAMYNILIEFGVPMTLVRLIKMHLIKMHLYETYSKVHTCKHLFNCPIQKGLKKGDALSRLLFNSALEYAVRKVQENQVALKLNGTHYHLAYANDVNLLEDNIDTMNKNTETLIDASKAVGLEINIENVKYMLVSNKEVCLQVTVEEFKYIFVPHYQNAGHADHMKLCHSLRIWERQQQIKI
jgi:hypothetical protein